MKDSNIQIRHYNMSSSRFFDKWYSATSLYGATRYIYKTHNAKVRYIDNTHRDMVHAEKLLIIGVGVGTAPILAPLWMIRDLTAIECNLRRIDPNELGIIVSKERDSWLDYIQI